MVAAVPLVEAWRDLLRPARAPVISRWLPRSLLPATTLGALTRRQVPLGVVIPRAKSAPSLDHILIPALGGIFCD